jgi:two-component system, response regulator PdtaR
MGRGRSWSLLIADDDRGFREALRHVFEPWFELFEAESGEEAVALVEYRRVDVALLDMHMPVMTGLETLRVIKQVHVETPCILITADATDELRRTATEASAFSVLKKPVSRRELMETVSTALSRAYSEELPFRMN